MLVGSGVQESTSDKRLQPGTLGTAQELTPLVVVQSAAGVNCGRPSKGWSGVGGVVLAQYSRMAPK
jgi:hypothetical protein